MIHQETVPSRKSLLTRQPAQQNRWVEQDATDEREFLRIPDAAKRWPFSEAFLRKKILRKEIPYHKVDRCVWLRRSDIEAFIEHGRVEARAAV